MVSKTLLLIIPALGVQHSATINFRLGWEPYN
jgi:hypothetical protein